MESKVAAGMDLIGQIVVQEFEKIKEEINAVGETAFSLVLRPRADTSDFPAPLRMVVLQFLSRT
ncbi:hypothetical protein CJ201_04970 [Corynebacterium aurimucosum]|nr:hypothetical protein CJ201_04970 [Corynebacterium aurimucosum]